MIANSKLPRFHALNMFNMECIITNTELFHGKQIEIAEKHNFRENWCLRIDDYLPFPVIHKLFKVACLDIKYFKLC